MLEIADWAFMAVGALFELTNFTASKTEKTKGCRKCSNLIAMDHVNVAFSFLLNWCSSCMI